MKQESKFIAELEQKSIEQHRLVETQLIPDWAIGIGDWLAEYPWRILVPCSGLLYLLLRSLLGVSYREFILGLFGGFVR